MSQCYLYDIVDPNPTSVSSGVWMRVLDMMRTTGWFGEPGERYGFVSTTAHAPLVTGFFAHEGSKTGIQYDEDKRPTDTSTESFEHLFFAIFTDTSQVLLQHRNIYGYDDLGLPKMRNSFLDLLALLLRNAGIYIASKRVQIESAGERYSQKELRSFFESNSIFTIEVKNLSTERIPDSSSPEYNLYNPKDDWNPITWGAVSDTLRVGAKNITIEAEQGDPNAQLNKGPLPKAFSRVGEIERVYGRTDEGRIVFRKRVSDREVSIDLPATPHVEDALINAVLAQFDPTERVEGWERRMEQRDSDQRDGTLYQLDQNN